MNTIRDYVETMFKGLPATDDVRRLKRNILDAMEDKYNELISEGKSENEAIGAVISQFGNIDELKEELGIKGAHDSKENAKYVDHYELIAYLSFKKRFAFMIAFGVVLCILSIISPILTNDALFMNIIHFENKQLSAIGIFIMFLMVAIGVFIFIFYGIKNSRYQALEETSLVLDEKDAYDIRCSFEKIQSRHSIVIAVGVVLCILGVATTVALYELWDFDFFAVILVSFVASGVFLFIYHGIIYSSYHLFVENHKAMKQRNEDDENDHYFGITMPLAAMLYLFIGFCFQAWHPGWLIFPLTAILTTAYISIKNMKKS